MGRPRSAVQAVALLALAKSLPPPILLRAVLFLSRVTPAAAQHVTDLRIQVPHPTRKAYWDDKG